MDKIIGSIIVMIVVALFALFIYFSVFRSKNSNNPTAFRGAGITLLGGIIIGICAIIKDDNVEVGNWVGYFQIVGKIILGLGALLIIVGLARNK